MSGITHSVEQRRSQTIGCQFLAESRKSVWSGGKLERDALVVRRSIRHQFRQSDRLEQTGRDAPGKARAGAGKHRQSRPQRVARRRVRVVWHRIEEQIGQPVTRQMIFIEWRARRKDKPRRIDVSALRMPAQIAFGRLVHVRKPQHTALYS